jgi:hypothetical protein
LTVDQSLEMTVLAEGPVSVVVMVWGVSSPWDR